MADVLVATDLTFVDHLSVGTEEVIRLIREHAKFAQVTKWKLPISAQLPGKAIKFPACQVQPRTWTPTPTAIAKYDMRFTCDIFVYHVGNDPQKVGDACTRSVSILQKLFSDNAFDDTESVSPTGRFFVNTGFWVESTFTVNAISSPLAYGREKSESYFVGAQITFQWHDVVLP